jgi:hypothetical protein
VYTQLTPRGQAFRKIISVGVIVVSVVSLGVAAIAKIASADHSSRASPFIPTIEPRPTETTPINLFSNAPAPVELPKSGHEPEVVPQAPPVSSRPLPRPEPVRPEPRRPVPPAPAEVIVETIRRIEVPARSDRPEPEEYRRPPEGRPRETTTRESRVPRERHPINERRSESQTGAGLGRRDLPSASMHDREPPPGHSASRDSAPNHPPAPSDARRKAQNEHSRDDRDRSAERTRSRDSDRSRRGR